MIELNKIYNEDCLETMKRMPDNFVDLVITSPPYNLGHTIKSRFNSKLKEYNIYNDNLPKKEYIDWLLKIIKELYRITKYHIAFNIMELSGNKGIIKEIYVNYYDYIKNVIIWVKKGGNPSVHKNRLTNKFEYIFIFSKDKPEISTYSYYNFNSWQKDIIITNGNSKKEIDGHNYGFPEDIPYYFITNFSKVNDIIYDPFMGSGTTAKVAILNNRNYIGSEISKNYCDIAIKRIKKYEILENSKLF